LIIGGRLEGMEFTARGDHLVALTTHGGEGRAQEFSTSVLSVFGRNSEARWVEFERVAVPGAYAVLESSETFYTAVGAENDEVLKILNPRDSYVHCRLDTRRYPNCQPWVSLSPDGTLLAVAVPEAEQPGLWQLEIWNAKTSQLLHQLQPRMSSCEDLKFSP